MTKTGSSSSRRKRQYCWLWQNEDFHLQIQQADHDEEYSTNDEGGNEDEDVSFKDADIYNITELLGYVAEDIRVKDEDGLKTIEEVINKLKHGYVVPFGIIQRQCTEYFYVEFFHRKQLIIDRILSSNCLSVAPSTNQN